ncbi:phosphotransferase family protein [Kribbella sp. GL6]|uniref:phosphotransferase family protein n=1 Tax=Kribbella sp. GL6 TaxID=3419765 RepID=UPI003D06477C
MHHPLTYERRDAVLDGLARMWGHRPVVVDAQQVGHEWAPVTRLVFEHDEPVIVKTRRVDGVGHGGPAYLRREVAGLRTAEVSGVAARVLLADDQAGVVVQSDLGRWPTLETVLLGDDPDRAAAAMVDFARTIGRLHASTRDRRTDHELALAEFGSADVTTGEEAGTGGIDRWGVVETACADLGLPDARSARDDIAFVRRQFDEPGPYAALAHHDINPTNALVTDHGVRLVDFEGARFGHIGFDVSFLHYPFPHYSAHWSTLPEAIIRAADDAYRGIVTLDGLDEAIAVGAAAALASRVLRLPLVARDDQSAHDSWRRRGQIVQQIGVFGWLAERAGILPELARWSRELAAAMTARWPDATNPPPRLFPAFDR